jgi:type I restriction enzyme S subunit
MPDAKTVSEASRPLVTLVTVDPETLPMGTAPNYTFRYIDIAAATKGRLLLPDDEIEYRDAPSRARRVLRDQDVIMSTVRPNLKAFAYCRLPPGNFVASTGFAVLRAKVGTDPRFILYSILSDDVTRQIERFVVGSNYPAINSSDVKRLRIRNLSPGEQERIGEIIGTVDEAIQQTEALIAKTQQIKAGLMHDLFTRGVSSDGQLRPPREEAPHLYRKWAPEYVPSSWDRETLGELTPDTAPICYGIVQPGEHKPDGVPVVAIYNLNVDFTTTLRSSREIESAYVRSRIRGGDVLLSIKGSIGRVDVAPDGFVGNISRDVARIRPRPGIHPDFLRYALECEYLQTGLFRISVGTTRAELSIGRLKQVPVYLPPESEQVAIASRLAAVDESLKAERHVLGKLGQQKRGLMADLLSGRVPLGTLADPKFAEGAADV